MSNIQILVVDDEPDILQLLKISLARMGLTVFTAATIGAAKSELDKTTFHFCLTDMKLPDGNGLELVEYVNRKYPNTPIAVITAYGTINHAVEALKKGAFDFITKPISIQVLRNLVANAIKASSSPQQIDIQATTRLPGYSNYIHEMNATIKKLAKSQSAVTIHGPVCTSKKTIAKCIHNLSHRRSNKFYHFDCIEDHQEITELFGDNSQNGLLAEANGSTLFLENIGGMSLVVQNKLLHILNSKKIDLENGEQLDLDIRFISSCCDDLEQKIKLGGFKQPLYDRLCVIKIVTEPLIQHKEDIPGLCKVILKEYSEQWQQLPCKIDSAALNTLCLYDYPGNMLELKNILERAANLCDNNIIRESDLGFDDEQQPALLSQRHNKNLEEYIEEIEVQEITNALKLTNNNKTAAAKVLGISFRALRYRIKKLGID
ncbi:Type IV fimbriae expression regulatory protein PilR [hydrothermal vent metagenome]|uniref:Type IV fimbriae expression regulatory protein PilR n=1 Tax=hydrothermal vent metagenome TaxID=652676 RepID=A0A3B0UYP2_9ZZZZ